MTEQILFRSRLKKDAFSHKRSPFFRRTDL